MFSKEISILIADDMAGAREYLRAQLTALGYLNVMEADDGDTALASVQSAYQLQMPVGLIISDWMMPRLSGLDFLIRVRGDSFLARTPFLMVTAEGDSTQVVKAIQAGVTDYIVKPFTSETFFKKLQNVWKKTQGK